MLTENVNDHGCNEFSQGVARRALQLSKLHRLGNVNISLGRSRSLEELFAFDPLRHMFIFFLLNKLDYQDP